MISSNILTDILKNEKSKVYYMLLVEYDEKKSPIPHLNQSLHISCLLQGPKSFLRDKYGFLS